MTAKQTVLLEVGQPFEQMTTRPISAEDLAALGEAGANIVMARDLPDGLSEVLPSCRKVDINELHSVINGCDVRLVFWDAEANSFAELITP